MRRGSPSSDQELPKDGADGISPSLFSQRVQTRLHPQRMPRAGERPADSPGGQATFNLDSADPSLAQLPGKGGDSVSQSEPWDLPHAGEEDQLGELEAPGQCVSCHMLWNLASGPGLAEQELRDDDCLTDRQTD